MRIAEVITGCTICGCGFVIATGVGGGAGRCGTGATGTYTLNFTQAVQSSPMDTALPNQNSVQVQSNQVPVVTANDIAVTVT